MRDNSANGNAVPHHDLPVMPPEDTGVVLDDELNTAARPILYLLASNVIAVAAYFVYALLHG